MSYRKKLEKRLKKIDSMSDEELLRNQRGIYRNSILGCSFGTLVFIGVFILLLGVMGC